MLNIFKGCQKSKNANTLSRAILTGKEKIGDKKQSCPDNLKLALKIRQKNLSATLRLVKQGG